ncbi:MAG: glucosaminidase domain-containing protein [Desulfobacterales bacterium]|nr:glucosaminidase domain-containing protein [Desulfobacterales bacterium]MBS3754271.1 glucosaminidase domain-containing protein [Desulfobacterales bacterium]
MRFPTKDVTTLIAALLFVAAGFLHACGEKDPYADIAPEKIIGQVQLPPLSESGQGHPAQSAAADRTNRRISAQKPATGDVDTKLPDFSKYTNIQKKKKEFFNFLRPIIRKENWRVLKQRAYVLQQWKRFQDGREIQPEAIERLKQLAENYRVDAEFSAGTEFFRKMLIHVDKIPVELALIQAAKESAWGTSYFAQKGNNLFGQWCFNKGCGIVPRRRPQGATYEVQKFDDVSESARAYVRNLNSHPAYKELRIQRYRMRLAGGEPTGHHMAKGLEQYSGIGMAYVNTVRKMIRGNQKFMGIHGESGDM